MIAGRLLPLSVLSVVWLCSSACGRENSPDPSEELTAVDVPPALSVSIEGDPQATARTPSLVGVLPEDFPSDLPLYLPASLIDFGTSADGSRYVALLSSGSRAKVSSEIESLLRDKGWAPAGSGTWRRSGKQVRLSLEDGRPGTVYRYEY